MPAGERTATPALPFRPGSLTWTVNMEPAVLLGGGRALLLQVLHPLVAAGVEQHSTFERDPFRRGFRTMDVMLKLAFGDPATSQRQSELLRRVHERVVGVSREGIPYRALDPALLRWVWATLVDTSILVFERAVRPLTDDEREKYYAEQKLVAEACGLASDACPPRYADFVEDVRRTMDMELQPTEVARVVAYAGRHPPLRWPLGPFLGGLMSFVTAGLLPPPLRAALGYRWGPLREYLLGSLFALSRLAARTVPFRLRTLPIRYLIRRPTPLGWWGNRPLRLPEHMRTA